MSKSERVLSDEEVDDIVKNTTMLLGRSIARSKDFILRVEQAVLAKLAEQEPVAWASSKIVGHYIPHETKVTAADWFKDGLDVPLYTHPMPSPSDLSDKTACVSENGESDRELARHQPCGCVICYCENQERCLGCGAKHCGTHDVDEIPNPVYVDHIPDASKMVECAKCGNTAIHHLIMDNLGYPNKTPLCSDCTQEHEHLAQDTNDHEIRNFGGAYGLVAYHYEPLGTAQPDHIPDAGKMITGNQSGSIDESHAKIISAVQNYADKRVMAVYGNAGETEVHEAYCNLAARIQAELEALQENSNHIADMRKMVADMYWINPDYPSYTSILDAFDPILSAADVEIGDQFEVGRAKTLPTLTIEVTELEENGDVKDFKVLSGDHVVDSDKMVTPLAQRKIQTLLDKGEYRVIENATVLVNENGHAAIVNKGGAFYWVDNEALAREFDGRAAPVDIASDMCAALSSPLLRTRIKREVGKT